MKKIIIGLLLIFSWQSVLAEDKRIWNNLPITIVLPVNKEVRVTFPTDVIIQIPEAIAGNLESLAPNQQLVYWKAKSPFDTQRILATSTDNETVYLIDLVASENQIANEPILIEDPNRLIANSNQDSSDSVLPVMEELRDPPEILLTRFVAQTLYAPRRLVPQSPDIQAIHINDLPDKFPLMQSQWGEQYQFKIVGAWSGYGRYITAVLVINLSNTPVRINPGLIRGNFTHITPQHLSLDATGKLSDRTTLYLISDAPFESAILEEGYGY